MKTLFTLLLLATLCVGASASSYPHHVETILSMRNENGDIASVIFGIDTGATKGLDLNLGEFAVPGFPPPGAGLLAYLAFKDNSSSVASYKDFRPLGSSTVLADTFQLLITPASDNSRGSKVAFTWAYPIDPNIDSIVVSDLLGGLLLRFKFDKREADTLTGNAMGLENFQIMVYYNLKLTGVSEEQSPLSCSSLVANNGLVQLTALSQDPIAHVDLFDLQGTQALSTSAPDMLDLRSLPNGQYFAHLYTASGSCKLLRVLKP